MALEKSLVEISLPANADLSTYQFRAVKVVTGGKAALADGSTVPLIGVLGNKPSAAGQGAAVGVGGICQMEAGTTVAVGDLITSNAVGQGIPTTTQGNTIVGRAITAAGSAAYFDLLLSPGVA